MYNDILKEACNRIERSTVYDAFNAFRELLGRLIDPSVLYEMAELHHSHELKWKDLAAVWRKAALQYSLLASSGNYYELMSILENREKREKWAMAILPERAVQLFYKLENKNFRELLLYMNNEYDLCSDNVNFAFAQEDIKICNFDTGVIDLAPVMNSKEFNRINEPYVAFHTKKNSLRKKLVLKYIQKTYIKGLDHWDQFFDYCKLLTSEQDVKANGLRDVLDCLSLIRQNDSKSFPTRYLMPCSLCWRMVPVSQVKKKTQARCHVHEYRKLHGTPARKKAYERALKINALFFKYRFERPGLIHDIAKHFSRAKIHELVYSRILKWWLYDPKKFSRAPIKTGKIPQKLWQTVPYVAKFLRGREINLESPPDVVQGLMPAPPYADEKAMEDYLQWIALWGEDFRFFVPILARADLWLDLYTKLYPSLPVDS